MKLGVISVSHTAHEYCIRMGLCGVAFPSLTVVDRQIHQSCQSGELVPHVLGSCVVRYSAPFLLWLI